MNLHDNGHVAPRRLQRFVRRELIVTRWNGAPLLIRLDLCHVHLCSYLFVLLLNA